MCVVNMANPGYPFLPPFYNNKKGFVYGITPLPRIQYEYNESKIQGK